MHMIKMMQNFVEALKIFSKNKLKIKDNFLNNLKKKKQNN